MKIALVSSDNYQATSVIEAGKRAGHQVDRLELKYITTDMLDSLSLFDYDLVYWRVNHINTSIRAAIAQLLSKKNIPMINEGYLTQPMLGKKSYQVMKAKSEGILLPRTVMTSLKDEGGINKIISDLSTPLIAKPAVGAQGKGVQKLDSPEEVKKLFESEDIAEYLFQQFLPNDGDYRTVVIGHKAVGAYKRIPAEGEFRANISLGGSGEPITDESTKQELYKIAEKVSSVFDLDICGVDIIKSDEKYYFIEVNSIVQWEGFEKTTGLNIGDKIIEYFEGVVNNKS